MAPRPTLSTQLLITALATAMVATLLLSLNGFWRQSFSWHLLLTVAAAGGGLAWFGWHHPRTLLALLLAACLAAVLVVPLDSFLAVRYQFTGLTRMAAAVSDLALALGAWVDTVRAGQVETMPPQVALFFLCVVGLIAAMAILWEALTRGDTFWSLLGGAALFGLQWALFWDAAEPYLVAYLASGITMWALAHVTQRRLRWAREKRRVQYPPIKSAGVLSALLVVGAGLVLPEFPPINLGRSAEHIRQMFPALQRLRGGSGGWDDARFDLNRVGFGGDASRLGGPVRLQDGTAFQVELAEPLTESLYLRGTIRRQYTGRGWLPPPVPETEAAAGREPRTRLSGAVTARTYAAAVIPAMVETDTLFHLLEPVRIEDVPGWRFDEDGNLLAPRVRRAGERYTFVSRAPVPSVAEMRTLGRSLAPADRALWEPYLAVPNTPEMRAVAELARQVAAGREHPIDQALAVEAFLRSNFPYDLAPPPPAENRDFTYQFLFETRRGYCVYHSTAMAIMLRTLGIPTRWVEGFVIPPTPAAGRVDVPISQAHAWVEAWIEGYGWVTFDPTPRADFPPIDRSYVPPPVPVEEPAAAAGPGDLSQNRGPANPRGLDEGEPPSGIGMPVTAPPRVWLGLALASGALLLLALGWAWLRWRVPVPHDPRLAVQHWFHHTGRLLGCFGYGPAPEMTAMEYARALGAVWPDLAPAARALAEVYQAARYGPPGLSIPADAPAQARRFHRQVWAALQARFGRGYCWWRLCTTWRPTSHNLRLWRAHPGQGGARDA